MVRCVCLLTALIASGKVCVFIDYWWQSGKVCVFDYTDSKVVRCVCLLTALIGKWQGVCVY